MKKEQWYSSEHDERAPTQRSVKPSQVEYICKNELPWVQSTHNQHVLTGEVSGKVGEQNIAREEEKRSGGFKEMLTEKEWL